MLLPSTTNSITHRIHVWYIYLHLVVFHGTMQVNIPCMDAISHGSLTMLLQLSNKNHNQKGSKILSIPNKGVVLPSSQFLLHEQRQQPGRGSTG